MAAGSQFVKISDKDMSEMKINAIPKTTQVQQSIV